MYADVRYIDGVIAVDMPYPDSLSVMTYIFELYRKFGKGGSKSKNVAKF